MGNGHSIPIISIVLSILCVDHQRRFNLIFVGNFYRIYLREMDHNEIELNSYYLLEYMEFLDKNLSDDVPRYLVRSDPCFPKEIKIHQKPDRFLKQVKVIQKKMRFLRYLYGSEINGTVDHEKLEGLEARMQFMADNVAQFCLTLWINGMDADATANLDSTLAYLLCLIVLVELEMQKLFAGELKASKFSQSGFFKDQNLPKGFSHLLHIGLVHLRNKKLKNLTTNVSTRKLDVAVQFLLLFFANVPDGVINGKTLNEFLGKVGTLVGDIIVVVQKFLSNSLFEDEMSEISLGMSKIPDKIEHLKAEMEERYCKSLKFSPSQHPSVGGLGFVDFLLRKLNEVLKSESGLYSIMKPHIGILKEELSLLRPFLGYVAEVQHEHDILKDLQKRIISMAYESEVSIDSIVVQCDVLHHLFCSLPAIIKEFKLLSAEVTKIWSKNPAHKSCPLVTPSKRMSTQHRNTHTNDEDIVGFNIDTKRIIQRLIKGRDEQDVISIVGMAGQGKTTFVKKLYSNHRVVRHFDVRAWCSVSQSYNLNELLLEVFAQVTGFKGKEKQDDNPADMVRKSLMGKRYLIVLDDMWEVMAWDELRLSFPDSENGSRILLTTRLLEVAKQVKHYTDPYFLPFLTPKESWELLQKKVFQNECCPPELYQVSQSVAEKCKGLPLVIVLIAGIITRKKMEASWWLEVSKALFSYIGVVGEYGPATIQLSYDNLPEHLRPCLLYMGMFPEDLNFEVPRLINLWIAEGIVQGIESMRLEEVAEGYLMDLISCSLVMVSKRGYKGKVKYCQLHDLVLDFCLKRSREEKFMLVMKGPSLDFSDEPSEFPYQDWKRNRLSFHLTDEVVTMDAKPRMPFNKHLRSLLLFASPDPFPQIAKLKLLKVLDMRSIRVCHLPSATLQGLIHLRYLSISTDHFNLRHISHMHHLETLVVDHYAWNVIEIPTTFWKMSNLKDVHISKARFDFHFHCNLWMFDDSSKLDKLRTLGEVLVSLDDTDRVKVLMQRCVNLQELEISLVLTDDDSSKTKASNSKFEALLNQLPLLNLQFAFEALTKLDLLNLRFDFGITVSELHLPSCLKILKLSGSPITRRAVSMIAELPNLEYLKLRDLGFEQEEWCMGDIIFYKLKFLKLENVNIRRWDASAASTFPLLETLVLKWCDKLEGIPFSFADSQTLKQIKVLWSNKSLEDSALEIKEEVEDIAGCDCLDIIIQESTTRFINLT